MTMQDVRDKKVTVAGLGRFGGGIAAAQWLATRGACVTVTDKEPESKLRDSVRQLENLPITFKLGGHDEADFTGADFVVASPAIPLSNPYLEAARKAGVSDETVAAVRDRRDAGSLVAEEAAIVTYVQQLLRKNRVEQPVFDTLLNRYGTQWLVELTALVGYYGLIAGVLNAFEVPEASGAERLPV